MEQYRPVPLVILISLLFVLSVPAIPALLQFALVGFSMYGLAALWQLLLGLVAFLVPFLAAVYLLFYRSWAWYLSLAIGGILVVLNLYSLMFQSGAGTSLLMSLWNILLGAVILWAGFNNQVKTIFLEKDIRNRTKSA